MGDRPDLRRVSIAMLASADSSYRMVAVDSVDSLRCHRSLDNSDGLDRYRVSKAPAFAV